jgi:hypothetical protein
MIASLGTGAAQAANTGTIKVHLNKNSCSRITSPSKDKIAMDVELRPERMDARYMYGDTSLSGKNDYDVWKLNTDESSVYTCHNPKPTPGGGYLEINYFEIHNEVGGFIFDNKLTDDRGKIIIRDGRSWASTSRKYYPPNGFKAFQSWPGSNSYSVRAEAYWLFGGGGQYAKLTINTSPN